jgi:hypothetical protein
MPLLYAPDGTLWPAGSLIRTISTDADLAFEAGTLPSWLTVPDGTSGASATDPGGVALTTAASTNAMATLQGPSIDLAELRRVRLDVCFTGGSATNRRIEVGFQGAAAGGWYRHSDPANYGGLVARAAGPTDTTQSVMYQVYDTAGTKRFSVAVIVDPADGLIAVGEHDHIWSHYDFNTALGTGAANPFIRVTTLDTTARTLNVHQVRLTREWL